MRSIVGVKNTQTGWEFSRKEKKYFAQVLKAYLIYKFRNFAEIPKSQFDLKIEKHNH